MENQNLSIELTVAQWNVVMSALGELPLKASIDVFSAIRTQAEAAIKQTKMQPE